MISEVFGREAEIAEVESRLADRRLVTLVGPGGIGKTALARVVAELVGPRFPLGAVQVDLTTVDDPAGVSEAVAGQLGYADLGSLLDSPGDQPVLLVIDNCEHVLDAAADLVDQLLASCRMPSIVATSRAPLDLDDESVVTVAPLATPPVGLDDASAPAVRLLVDRARHHGLALADDDLAAASEVCRRLDGVPLAIELAAARLRTVGLPELIEELDRAPHALARRRTRGQAHHRSVSELVAWSYELLAADERTVFVRLGVFAGPFPRDLAAILTADDDIGPDAAGAHLDALVGASLVTVDRSADVTRYRLLHPVRAVARDLLERSGDGDRLRSRLVDQVIERSLSVLRGGPDGWTPDLLHELIALYDDAAASVRWLLRHDEQPDRALLLVAVLWGVVHNAHSAEIHRLGEDVLARWPDPAVPRWANAAATVATCRFLRGDVGGAIELAELAVPCADRSRTAPALLQRVIAQSRRAAGDIEAAQATFRHGAELAAERGASGLAMELRVDEGLALIERGRVAEGLSLIDAVATAATDQGAPINRNWAHVARAAGERRIDPVAALPTIRAALAEARSIGYPAGTTFALRLLAAAELESGRDADAATALLELLDHLLQRGGLDELRVVLDLAAELMRRHGDRAWPDVAATAAAMPITSFLSPTTLEFVPDDRPPGRTLSTREVYVAVRATLTTIATDVPPPEHEPEADPASVTSGHEPGRIAVDEGEVWQLTFDGRTVRLQHSKGLDDIVRLLDSPGVEIAAVDLMGALVVAGGEDEILDTAARRAYEQRVRDLRSELDEAEEHHDLARAEQLRVEMDALVDQLTEAMGLGGRTRRTAGPGERARSAVTQRIRTTFSRIENVHPALGAHLRATISTGRYCRYSPLDRQRWTVRR